MNLAGKVALVTGAGTGIGQGAAIELGKRGAKVAVHYNSSASGAEATKRVIEEHGGEAITVQANVTEKTQIERMAGQVAARFGGIDILVNNAALQLNLDLLDYDNEAYDRMMSTNLKGYWQCMQAVIPYMKAKQSGRIINISSIHGKRPTDFDVVYAMTKGAIKMLGRESAIELAAYGITVNTIEPGAVDVGKSFTPPAELAERYMRHSPRSRKKLPLGRVGLPADIANMICYVASDESAFMTGSSIRLDGGGMLM